MKHESNRGAYRCSQPQPCRQRLWLCHIKTLFPFFISYLYITGVCDKCWLWPGERLRAGELLEVEAAIAYMRGNYRIFHNVRYKYVIYKKVFNVNHARAFFL